MELSVEIVPAPVAGEPPSPLVAAYAEVVARALRASFGNDDLSASAEVTAVGYSEQDNKRKVIVLARQVGSGAMAGGAYFAMPLRDNLRLAEGSFDVDPGADAAEVIPALWEVVRGVLREHGRTTAQVWAYQPLGQDLEHLVPRTGVGSVPLGPVPRALLELGFTLEQVERHSAVEVAAAQSRARTQGEVARAAAGTAYELGSYVGSVPEDLREAMARIMARMSTDVPSGDLDIEPEVWDADRVAELDRVAERMGRRRVTTLAREVATGEVVAYTVLDSPADKPDVAYQEDTLVHADHRGHRLGMLVKAANLELLARELPAVGRVHTWNAWENQHMLAINHALGFTDRSVEGAWQLTGL